MTLPNLNHLKYFVDAVELGSVSAAALKNDVTHPAVSRAISALENQLEVVLLVHRKNSFVVTAEGFRIAEQGRLLLGEAKKFGSSKKTLDRAVGGLVKVGVSRSLVSPLLLPALKKLIRAHSSIEVQIRLGTTMDILKNLAQGEIDIGLTIGSQPFPTLKQTILSTGDFVLIGTKGHSSSSNLTEALFLLTEARFETELLKKKFLKHYKEPLKAQLQVESWEIITQFVGAGLGIGLVPDISVLQEKSKSVSVLHVDWFQCSYDVWIHQLKTPNLKPAIRALTLELEQILS